MKIATYRNHQPKLETAPTLAPDYSCTVSVDLSLKLGTHLEQLTFLEVIKIAIDFFSIVLKLKTQMSIRFKFFCLGDGY